MDEAEDVLDAIARARARLAAIAASDVAARWRDDAARLRAEGPDRLPRHLGVPTTELWRTPAAARIGRMAADAGLFSFHFEHRVHLPLPEAWVAGDPDEACPPPQWVDGVLPERKYQSFRHDLRVASHHPAHRAKWGCHELCHGLVGFAWSPRATPYFHATAGRLAELLPVALWYGFDEAFLHRCPRHAGGGALYAATCEACERAAAPHPDDPTAVDAIAFGLRFVDRELAATAHGLQHGTIHPHRHATLELASDGVAYAHAHAQRLGSEAFVEHMAAFHPTPDDGVASLGSLVDRLLDVTLAMLGETEAPAPLAPTPAHARARWILQDLAWRTRTVAALAEAHGPDDTTPLDAVWRRLAQAVPATLDGPPPALDAVLAEVAAHLDGCNIPWADAILSPGYALPGLPADPSSLAVGLHTALPWVWDGLSEDDAARDALVAGFAEADDTRRRPLAHRFADWLAREHPGPLADLAHWEATARHLPPAQLDLGSPPTDDRVQRAPGWSVVRTTHDVLALADAVEAGAIGFRGPQLIAHDGPPPTPAPATILVGPHAEEGLVILDVDPATAEAWEALDDAGGVPALPADEVEALVSHGALQWASLGLWWHDADPSDR